MLPGEQGLPEAIFASDGQIVNRLFVTLSREADRAWVADSKSTCKSCSLSGFANIGKRCAVPHVQAKA